MVKVILQNGIFVPCDPLPDDWQEGTEFQVEKPNNRPIPESGTDSTDTWMDEVEAIASKGDPEDDLRLESVLLEIRTREKDHARRRLGLNG